MALCFVFLLFSLGLGASPHSCAFAALSAAPRALRPPADRHASFDNATPRYRSLYSTPASVLHHCAAGEGATAAAFFWINNATLRHCVDQQLLKLSAGGHASASATPTKRATAPATATGSASASGSATATVSAYMATVSATATASILPAACAVYMIDRDAHAVVRFDDSGSGTPETVASVRACCPNFLFVTPSGDVYVSDDRVYKITGGISGTSVVINGNFGLPQGVFVTPSGDVFSANLMPASILKIPSGGTGSPVTAISVPGYVYGLFVSPSGDIYFAGLLSGNIYKINGGIGMPVQIMDGFSGPMKVVVTTSGDIFVADMYGAVVKKIPGGIGTPEVVGSGFLSPTDVFVAPSGDVYVNDLHVGVYKIPGGTGTPVLVAPVKNGGMGMFVECGSDSAPFSATPSTTATPTPPATPTGTPANANSMAANCAAVAATGYTTDACSKSTNCASCVQQYSSVAGGYACGWLSSNTCVELAGGLPSGTTFTSFLDGTGTCANLLGTSAILQAATSGQDCTSRTSKGSCIAGYQGAFACWWDNAANTCNMFSSAPTVASYSTYFASC